MGVGEKIDFGGAALGDTVIDQTRKDQEFIRSGSNAMQGEISEARKNQELLGGAALGDTETPKKDAYISPEQLVLNENLEDKRWEGLTPEQRDKELAKELGGAALGDTETPKKDAYISPEQLVLNERLEDKRWEGLTPEQRDRESAKELGGALLGTDADKIRKEQGFERPTVEQAEILGRLSRPSSKELDEFIKEGNLNQELAKLTGDQIKEVLISNLPSFLSTLVQNRNGGSAGLTLNVMEEAINKGIDLTSIKLWVFNLIDKNDISLAGDQELGIDASIALNKIIEITSERAKLGRDNQIIDFSNSSNGESKKVDCVTFANKIKEKQNSNFIDDSEIKPF